MWISGYIDIKQFETAIMNIAIINYPHALQSPVYGLYELFEMANSLCAPAKAIHCQMLTLDQLVGDAGPKPNAGAAGGYDYVILPPAIKDDFYLNPSSALLNWLKDQHHKKARLCSACSGAFILAKAGLLDQRTATTHWGLVQKFKQAFPLVPLNSHKILINDGDVITAGGVMSWLDLGLEIVALHAGPSVMVQLGKHLVVDTGYRAQSYYEQFNPRFDHGDEGILNAQTFLDEHYHAKFKMAELAAMGHMSERSFLRRFQQGTGFKPTEYIQRLRIQKACDQLERSKKSFDAIALEVGYEDSSACRKVFVRVMGLTPKAFRQRFVR